MKKIGIFVFTYGKDEIIARKNLELLSKGDFKVFVIDDAREPWESSKNLPENAEYLQSSFERKGNLNGMECVKGMLSIMALKSFDYDLDYCVKLDSDCLLKNPWFGVGFNYCGSSDHSERSKYGWGSCYCLSKNAVAIANQALKGSLEWNSPIQNEDFVIGNVVNYLLKGEGFKLFELNGDNALYFPWMNPPSPPKSPYAVSCRAGNRYHSLEKTIEKVLENFKIFSL